MKSDRKATINGQVSRDFEALQDAFAGNFSRRHQWGGACCVYCQGEKVVDLWGGVRGHPRLAYLLPADGNCTRKRYKHCRHPRFSPRTAASTTSA